MRVCLMIEGQEDVTWDQWLALAVACEESGIEALFRSDHYLSVNGQRDFGSLDAWTTIAALAARTERIRLGTLVSPATFRHPSLLAKSVVTADHVSAGRVELGMGAGWHRDEHQAYGFPFPEARARMEMLEEQVEIVHRSWGEEQVTFDGRHYRLDRSPAMPKPVQSPHPPLIIGGHGGVRSLRLAARWADEYNTVSATPEECRALRARVEEAWKRADRYERPTFSMMTGFVVGTDRDELLRRTEAVVRRIGGKESPEAYLEGRGDEWVAGTPDEVVARLLEYEDAGVDRVMLQYLAHEDVGGVKLLGREIVPTLGG
jgi:F420-dependent oxidoreductase-like protein